MSNSTTGMYEWDLLLTGGIVMPMGGEPPINNGAVGVRGDRIVSVGDAAGFPRERARRVVDAPAGVLMPGFVNCHTHVGSNVLLRGLDEDVRLFEWLDLMWKMKRNFDFDSLYAASLVGLSEMLRAGITCFNEHFDAYAVEPQLRALQELPLRATLGYGLADRGVYETTKDASWRTLERFSEIVAEHDFPADGRVRPALSPHATYSCGPEMFRAVRDVATEAGVPIHVHLAEGLQEVEYVGSHYGVRPVEWLASLGVLADDVTCAHCTQLDAHDIELLAASGARIATCPVCNAKLCSGTLPLKEVMSAGITVGLATDGPASQNVLDMFQEMKFAGLLHKDKVGDPRFLTTAQLLELATTESALAMNQDSVGRLAPGFYADVIVVDLDGPHVQPVYDVAAALVYSCRADDVRYTVVGGKVLLDDREIIGVDEERVIATLRQLARDLRRKSLV